MIRHMNALPLFVNPSQMMPKVDSAVVSVVKVCLIGNYFDFVILTGRAIQGFRH